MSEQTITEAIAKDVTLDPERQGKAKEYAKIHHRLFFVDLGLGAAYVLIWLIAGINLMARDWVLSITQNPWLAVPLFALVFGIPYFLIDLPLSYYSGFVLPHKYDQSTQSLKDWVVDQIKGLAIAG